MNQTLCAFLCGESQKNAVGGEYYSPAKKREILPQTEKWFVGDDACIVPNDGLYRIYYHIIPRCKVFGRERSISGLRTGALPRLASKTRLRAQ